MANTLDDANFQLFDRFAGSLGGGLVPNPGQWAEASATAIWPVGTKIQVLVVVAGVITGFATLTYLKFMSGTLATPAVVKGICGLYIHGSTTNVAAPYVVTNDGGEVFTEGPIAIALGTMVNAYYAWFWTGGICPVNIVAGLDGDYVTDGTIVAGKGISLMDGTHAAKLCVKVDLEDSTQGVAGGLAFSADT